MFSRGGFDANMNQRRLPRTKEAIDAVVALAKDNPDKALIVTYIGELVAEGFAAWEVLANGDIEVCFTSGETFLLAEDTILRVVLVSAQTLSVVRESTALYFAATVISEDLAGIRRAR
jgi:hypothetical protein